MEEHGMDLRYMDEALKEAKIAHAKGEVPIGAVIVYGDRIIARSHNLAETLNDPTAHAEMQSITAAANHMGGKYLDQCTIYVTIEPCPMCAGALYWSRIGRLVWGANDPKRGFSLFKGNILHPKTVTKCGVREDDCSSIITSFFKSKR